jgi:hypothetical protein
MYSFALLLSIFLVGSNHLVIAMTGGSANNTQPVKQEDLIDAQKNKIGTIKLRYQKCYEAALFNNENQQIGSCCYRYDNKTKEAWIILLQINCDERRKGHGKQLLEYVHRQLLAQSCKKISGELPANNPNIAQYFAKFGATVNNKKLEFNIVRSKL